MAGRKQRLPKYKQVYRRYKKNAPRVPDITCPDIDALISRLETYRDGSRNLTDKQFKICVKELEKLRSANEALRDSGVYWNQTAKELITKYIAKRDGDLFSNDK